MLEILWQWGTKRSDRTARQPAPAPEGLQVLYSYEHADYDIILVHGVGGHPIETWTADNGVLWPRDLLPCDIPKIRVLSWGYKSLILGARHLCQSFLYYYADEMVAQLVALRKETGTAQRPIIFVGHSLGGILVKSALVRLCVAISPEETSFLSIRRLTCGIIFLGTPHRSACNAALGDILKKFVPESPRKEKILRSLSKEIPWLELRLDTFKSLLQTMWMIVCCETQSAEGVGAAEVKVPEACTRMKADTTFGNFVRMIGDHAAIARYHSSQDANYVALISLIQAEIQRLKLMHSPPCLVGVSPRKGNRVPSMNECTLVWEGFHFKLRSLRGRQGHFDHLQKILLNNSIGSRSLKVAIVNGEAGSGKSAIVQEFVYRNFFHFNCVFWLDVSTSETLAQSCRDMARSIVKAYCQISYEWELSKEDIVRNLGLESFEEKSDKFEGTILAITALQAWLSRHGNEGWLLVLENVKDSSLLRAFDLLNLSPSGCVIVVCRGMGAPIKGEQVSVGAVDESEILGIESDSTFPRHVREDIIYNGKLSNECGHGLLLYQCLPSGKFSESCFCRHMASLFQTKTNAAWQTFESSACEACQEASPLYAAFRDVKHLLDGKSKYSWQAAGHKLLSKDSGSALIDDFVRFWQRRDDFHKIAATLREQPVDSSPEQLVAVVTQVLVKGVLEACQTYVHSELQRQMLRWIFEHIPPLEVSLFHLVDQQQLLALVNTCYRLGLYKEASAILRHKRVPAYVRGIVPSDYVKILVSRFKLLLKQELFLDSINQVHQALRIFGNNTFEDPEQEIEVRFILASALAGQYWNGKRDGTEGRTASPVDATSTPLGSEVNMNYHDQKATELQASNPKIPERQNDILQGNAKDFQSFDLEQELKVVNDAYKHVLRLSEDVLGCINPHTMKIVRSFAAWRERSGRLEEAEWLLRRYVLWLANNLGLDDTSTISEILKLARICRAQNRMPYALREYEKVLVAYERRLEADHPFYLNLCVEVAAVYERMERIPKSNELFQRAVDALPIVYGHEHTITTNAIEAFASSLSKQGQQEKADRVRSIVGGTAGKHSQQKLEGHGLGVMANPTNTEIEAHKEDPEQKEDTVPSRCVVH